MHPEARLFRERQALRSFQTGYSLVSGWVINSLSKKRPGVISALRVQFSRLDGSCTTSSCTLVCGGEIQLLMQAGSGSALVKAG